MCVKSEAEKRPSALCSRGSFSLLLESAVHNGV